MYLVDCMVEYGSMLANSVLMVDSWVVYSVDSIVEVLSVLVYSITVEDAVTMDSVDLMVEDGSVLVVSIVVVYDEGPNVVGKFVVLCKVVGSIDAIVVGLNCCITFFTILMIKEKVRGTGWFERDG